jgi:hypothetical protein
MSAPAANPLPILLLEWRPLVKGALRGFATLRLGRSLKINDVPVLASNGKLWAALPGKPLVDRDGRAMLDARGKQRFTPILEWSDKAAADRFSQAVVDAVRAEHGPEALEPMA